MLRYINSEKDGEILCEGKRRDRIEKYLHKKINEEIREEKTKKIRR